MTNIAVSCIAWSNTEHQQVATVLRQLGVNTIEAIPGLFQSPLNEVTDAQANAERKFWANNGLTIRAMQALLFGRPDLSLFGTDNDRNILATYLREVFRVAQGLGAHSLIFGSPKNRQRGSLSFGDAFDIAANFFSGLAGVAYDHGCVLCIEANSVAYHCDFVTTHAEAIALVQAVNHPGFGLQIDTGVMLLNGETPDSLARQLDDAKIIPSHLHVSRPFLEPVNSENEDFLSNLKKQLESRKYPGLYSIEMKRTSPEATITNLQIAVKSVLGL